MIIAKEKRKENIVEYILYMYQIEDTIRACSFDMEIIEERVISQFSVSDEVKMEIRDWYANIIVMMQEEGINKTGHIALLKGLISDLDGLHLQLLNEIKDTKYSEQYSFAETNIREFEKKLGGEPESEIQTCVTALYALLLFRIQKKSISQETIQAMQTFSNMLAVLSAWYKKIEEGKTEL